LRCVEAHVEAEKALAHALAAAVAQGQWALADRIVELIRAGRELP
jgi:hypothetical protein